MRSLRYALFVAFAIALVVSGAWSDPNPKKPFSAYVERTSQDGATLHLCVETNLSDEWRFSSAFVLLAEGEMPSDPQLAAVWMQRAERIGITIEKADSGSGLGEVYLSHAQIQRAYLFVAFHPNADAPSKMYFERVRDVGEKTANQALQTTPMTRSVYERTIEFGCPQRGV